MANEERARILRMVSEGTVSPAEAEDLLAALETPRAESRPIPPTPPAPPAPPTPPALPLRAQRRSLVIQVSEGGQTKVNVRIPLGLARAASKFIPRNVQAQLSEHNIDLDELLQGIAGADNDGSLIEVKDGDDRVLIAVQ